MLGSIIKSTNKKNNQPVQMTTTLYQGSATQTQNNNQSTSGTIWTPHAEATGQKIK